MNADRSTRRRLRAAFHREFANAPARAAEGVARLVRNSSDARIERVMGSPIRYLVLGAIFSQMPRYFDGERAASTNATIRFEITGRDGGGADVWDAVILDGLCRVRRIAPNESMPDSEPRLAITMSAAEFLRLATGNLDPMKAYLSGRIKLGGDIFFAATMQSLFRVPSAQPARTFRRSIRSRD